MSAPTPTNKIFQLLTDLVERDPEFDYRRSYVRLSSAPDKAALLYVRQKIAQVAAEISATENPT